MASFGSVRIFILSMIEQWSFIGLDWMYSAECYVGFHCTSWQLLSFKLNCVLVWLSDFLCTTLAINVFHCHCHCHCHWVTGLYTYIMKFTGVRKIPHTISASVNCQNNKTQIQHFLFCQVGSLVKNSYIANTRWSPWQQCQTIHTKSKQSNINKQQINITLKIIPFLVPLLPSD